MKCVHVYKRTKSQMFRTTDVAMWHFSSFFGNKNQENEIHKRQM